jgi:hypothetical protein
LHCARRNHLTAEKEASAPLEGTQGTRVAKSGSQHNQSTVKSKQRQYHDAVIKRPTGVAFLTARVFTTYHVSKTLSLVIPTFRERDNIRPLVERIDRALDGIDYEVVFIDDNSRDGTEELVHELAAANHPVRIVVRTDKRGLASAVVDGFTFVDGEAVAVMDADLQHPLRSCRNCYRRCGTAPIRPSAAGTSRVADVRGGAS